MTVQTEAYRLIGRLAARRLGRLECVLGVYARRSVATGEVAFGRSDIDLHIVIRPSPSAEAEGELLADLVAAYNRLRRLVPVLGHAWVSTRDELERWYREQPYEWYRDRGWLRLWGEEFERPSANADIVGHEGLLWWYAWAVWSLPEVFQRGNARQCYNLLLDMFDVYRLYAGLSSVPLLRSELFELWWESGEHSRARELIARARRHGFRVERNVALGAVYRESLVVHDMLFERVACRLGGTAKGSLESRVPPLYVRRRYELAEASDGRGVELAVEAMRQDPAVWLLNERGLKLYLAYRNPWEYPALSDANPELAISRPPEGAYRLGVQRALYRESLRTFGFVGQPRFSGPLYEQRRLYLASGFVARDLEELHAAYRQRDGAELVTDMPVGEYFTRAYPAICKIIDELRAVTSAGPPSA
jgi:predicted nucleotidyltransferase